MKNRFRKRILAGLVVALIASSALAQTTSSSMSGRIVDAAGKPVAGATVEILHVPSNSSRTVLTDADGRYSAQGLRVGGPFDVKASGDHGEQAEQENVYLQLSQETTLNLSLGAAAATELAGVTVTAAAPGAIFQPDNKGLSTNISSRELADIPTPNRSIQDIARTDPRITITDRARGEISALGQNSRYNNITIDGVPTNDIFGLEANGLPSLRQPISMDWIEEYNLSTANFDVATRRGLGADINAVTKSGTNDFHGELVYAYTNADDLTGEDPNGNKYKGYDNQWTAGINAGGPIIKDTLFFFLGYEEAKTIAPGPDFGPIGSNATNIVPVTQDQLNRIIDIAQGYGLIPGDLNASSANLDDKKYLAKIDWNINDSHRASFRYNEVKSTQPIIQGLNANGLGLSSYWYTNHRDFKNYVANFYDDWTDTFSSEASVSYAKYDTVRSALAQQPQVFINLGTDANGIPNGTGPFVDLGEDQFTDYNVLHVKEYNAMWAGTWALGDHSIKAGADFQRDNYYDLFGRTQFGAYVFWGIDNFANGQYNTYNLYQPTNGDINSVAAQWDLDQIGFFVQDTWQATSQLSLQYGFRVDIPSTDDHPAYSPLFQQTFGFRNNTNISGNSLFEPRLSFNYDFDTQYKTQLRGGVGLFITNPPGVWLTNPFSNNGVTTTTYFQNNRTNDQVGVNPDFPPFSSDPFGQGIPPPGQQQQAVDTIDKNFEMPSAWKYSLALDRELPWWGLVFSGELEYMQVHEGIRYIPLNLGTPTGQLPDGRNYYYASSDPSQFVGATPRNRANANPNFSNSTNLLVNTGKGYADNLTLSLKKALTDDWFGMVGVGFGNAREVNPGTSSQASSNFSNSAWYNPGEDVASPSNYAIRQRFIASLTWQHKFWGDYISSASMFYDGHTGVPYSWVFANDANGDSFSGSDLVYIPRGPGDVQFAQGTPQSVQDEFFNYIKSDDYLKHHLGQVAGRNAARSPWVNQLDLSFRQEVPAFFPSGAKGQVKLDIFNFLNMLNKDWGRESRVGFPYTRDLATFAGVDPATGQYVYSLPTRNGHYAPESKIIYDDNAVSRWSVLVTLTYKF
jgi:hypothetical protein